MQSADGTATKASSKDEVPKKTASSDTANESPSKVAVNTKKTPSNDTTSDTTNETPNPRQSVHN